MRIGCKAHVKVKLDPKEGCCYFDAIDLYHNHQLHPEKRMTCFMRSHKNKEDGVKNLMEVMARAGVQHQAQMNVMSELYDGQDSGHSWSGI
jgi:predicted nucleotidyltransferase